MKLHLLKTAAHAADAVHAVKAFHTAGNVLHTVASAAALPVVGKVVEESLQENRREGYEKRGGGNGWKCAAFLLIGLAAGYLLSPAKGGVLIGSFNGAHADMPAPLAMPGAAKRPDETGEAGKMHRCRKRRTADAPGHTSHPFAGCVVLGSFNGAGLHSAASHKKSTDAVDKVSETAK